MAGRRNNPAAPLIPPVQSALRLTVVYAVQGQTFETVIDYLAAGGADVFAADLLNFIAAWRAANEANLLAVLSQNASVVQYRAGRVDVNFVRTQVVNVNLAGTVPQPALPEEMASIAQKISTLRGQHGQGRAYWPAVPVTFTTPAVDPNRLNVLGATSYGVLHLSLEGAVVFSAGVFSATCAIMTRPIPPAFLVTNAAQGPITWSITPLLGTQRRRREGRGI